jgi:putative hydrolase of the HAD superfamily
MSRAIVPGCADALLFDLGRVVMDCDPTTLASRFCVDDDYRAFETGAINTDAYFTALRRSLALPLSHEQFLEGWNATFDGIMPGIEPLLPRAARQFPLYVFSNTNRAHEAHFMPAYGDLLTHFKTLFLSSTIGLRKPDAAAYDHVVSQIGVPASRIVFFDDLKENIEGAEARGLIGVHVRSSGDIARALDALGC